MKKYLIPFTSFAFFIFSGACGQGFYDLDTIQNIEIQFTQSNWDYILDTSKQGKDGYTIAQWVKINGIQFDSAGVKYKGNSSYNPTRIKNPIHIELNYVKNQDYQGYTDIKLSNGFKDPSFVREVLSYNILRNYMHASLSNFAKVTINGQAIGMYANTEAINKGFVESRFFTNTHSFFFMDNFGGNLSYKGPDSTLYYQTYTMKSDFGWADLVNLCLNLKTNISGIENFLDVDRVLWMLAFDNVLVNLDSYIGQPYHNYYIYRDHNGRFNPIVWDVNEAFGNFANAGGGPPLTITQEQNMSPMIHSNDSLWPLIKNLLAIPKFKKMYIAHMRTIVSENFSNNSYFTTGQYLQGVVDAAVQTDPNMLFPYSQFQANLSNNVTNGNQTTVGIATLMNARTTYLNSTAEFQQVPPVVSNVNPSVSFPLINSSIYITANVSNATAVLLGKRNSVMEKFSRVNMFDDGAHGDGAAGDGTYGISVVVSSPELQFYVYAENNNAGIFSPERAEHEWYTVASDYATLSAGDVVINEIMAVNSSTVQNANGLFSDWVELYNTSPDTVILDHLNLSDDAANPVKWGFPTGLTIAPNGFLIVWADGDTSSGELHCTFKFSGSGEQTYLSYANGYVIDSISFPLQSADVSWGRYPNGTGPFVYMPPTFNSSNSVFSKVEGIPGNQVKTWVYPNPNDGTFIFRVLSDDFSRADFELQNLLGETVFSQQIDGPGPAFLNLPLPNGVYFYRLKNGEGIIGNGKIIIGG